jgi:hypothetical protein
VRDLVLGKLRPDRRHDRGDARHDRGDEERRAGPTASDTGPASAIDTGIRRTETKKSSDATRPGMCGGTRRCRSVPQMSIGAENIAPSTSAATAAATRAATAP